MVNSVLFMVATSNFTMLYLSIKWICWIIYSISNNVFSQTFYIRTNTINVCSATNTIHIRRCSWLIHKLNVIRNWRTSSWTMLCLHRQRYMLVYCTFVGASIWGNITYSQYINQEENLNECLWFSSTNLFYFLRTSFFSVHSLFGFVPKTLSPLGHFRDWYKVMYLLFGNFQCNCNNRSNSNATVPI